MYQQCLDFAEVDRQVLLTETKMLLHDFEGVFRLVPLGLQEQQQPLVMEELLVIVDLIFLTVLLKLPNLP